MQLQQLGLSGYGYSPSSSGAGTAAAAGGGGSTVSGSGTTGSASSLDPSASGLTGNVAELANVRESESLDFQLADGTQVTIRMRAHATALGASQTQSDGATSSVAALIASGQLQIEVNGKLSNDDLSAINNVVSQVNSLATQFFSGDVQDAFAAAASLNMDPSEIAGFSLKLSYSSELYQQATANAAAAAGAGATSGSGSGSTAGSTSGSTSTSTIPAAAITTNPGTSIAPGSTSTLTAASDASSGSSSGASSATASGTASGTSNATSSASPQQIIVNFLQQATAKLRVSSGGSHEHASSRWKMKFLAQALPAYAQALAAGGGIQASGTSGAQASTAGSSGSGAASATTGTSGAATTSPAAATAPASASSQATAPAQTAAALQPATSITLLQVARLAADTLIRLAEQ